MTSAYSSFHWAVQRSGLAGGADSVTVMVRTVGDGDGSDLVVTAPAALRGGSDVGQRAAEDRSSRVGLVTVAGLDADVDDRVHVGVEAGGHGVGAG